MSGFGQITGTVVRLNNMTSFSIPYLVRVLNLLLYNRYHSKRFVICVGRGLANVVITCVRSL